MSEQIPPGAFMAQWETLCANCYDVIYEGELAKYDSPEEVVHYLSCRKQPPLCLECFLHHNGECP